MQSLSRWLPLALIPMVWLGGASLSAAGDADCCVPIAAVAITFEVQTDTFKCCCPEQECIELEGQTTHRFGGYSYLYACGEGQEACEDPAAIPCGEMGLSTDVEHESTVGGDEAACECVEQGCWLMPPDCLDPNAYFWCLCTNPPFCIISYATPGCEGIDPGGDD